MKHFGFISHCLSFFFLVISTASGQQSNNVYFSYDRVKMVVPVILTDSTLANMCFDSGGSLIIDSTFNSQHRILKEEQDTNRILSKGGSNWGKRQTNKQLYNVAMNLSLGGHDIRYNWWSMMDWRGHWKHSDIDGMFGISPTDTAHVWFFNFENNYLQLIDDKDFEIPSDYNIFPLQVSSDEWHTILHVMLPLNLQMENGDTITICKPFFIDTGIHDDIALNAGAEEISFFQQREDAVWIYHMPYYKYYATKAQLNNLSLDSLRIYTYEHKNQVSNQYIMGLNFLKRFNVYIDLRHKVLALKPIKKFTRLIDKYATRLHIQYDDDEYRKNGRYIIKMIAPSIYNYYRTAGFEVGDEVVGISIIPSNDTIHKEIQQYSIIRDSKEMKIRVGIPQNAPLGEEQ